MVVKNKISKKKVKKISLRKSKTNKTTTKRSKKKSRKVSKKKIKQNIKKSYRKKNIRRSSTKKKKVKKTTQKKKKIRVVNKKYLKKLRISRAKSKRKRGLRVYTKKRRQKGGSAQKGRTLKKGISAESSRRQREDHQIKIRKSKKDEGVHKRRMAAMAAARLSQAQEIVSTWDLNPTLADFSIKLLVLYYGDILLHPVDTKQFGNPKGISPLLTSVSLVLQLLALQTYIRYFDPVHFNNDTFNQRWLFIVLFDYLLDHIHDFAKGPRNITTLKHSDILVDKLKKRRPETDQVFVFGLPYIDNFLKGLEAARGIQTPDSSSITWEMIYLPSIKLFHEKCFKTIMIPNENDVLNFIINQVCEGDMSVEQIDSKNILVGRNSLRKYLVSLRKNMSEFVAGDEGIKSFIKDFIKTINNQYFSKLEPFKEHIIKDESINIGGLLGLFTRALKIPIKDGGVLQEVFPNVIDPGSGSLSNVIAQMLKVGPHTVRTSIKGVPNQFITLRSYKPITLYYIKIEIKPTNSTEIIRVYYKDGNRLIPLGILDDSALSVDNVFVAYDYYIELVGGGESTPRSATGSLGVLYNLVWRLFDDDVPENVVIAILLDLKKGGDWLQVDFATMNNKGFETEDRECMAYAILVSCAVVFRYNYSSNGLLGAIKKIFTKIKERATVGAQVGGDGKRSLKRGITKRDARRRRQDAVNSIREKKYAVSLRNRRIDSLNAAPASPAGAKAVVQPPSFAQRELYFLPPAHAPARILTDSVQSQPLSPLEILVNELDNFSTGEIEYYGDYSDLIEELYDDDVMKEIRNYLLAIPPDINTDFGLIELEQMFSGVVRVFPEFVQEGGLRLEGITERPGYITSAQKILTNLINPSSFGSGLQIMCPYTRMELIITQELINTLGEIPKKIKLLQHKVPGVFLATISSYMDELINKVVGNMREVALNSAVTAVIEKDYRDIIKIYETLKKIVSNITSFTYLDAQPLRGVVPPGILEWQKDLALAAKSGLAPPQPPPVATLKGFLKTFKPFHKTALKNEKIIRKIMEDYEKLARILTLPQNETLMRIQDMRNKNGIYITTLQEIKEGVKIILVTQYETIERLNESIIQEATIDIMYGMHGNATRSEKKIINAYTLALQQFPAGRNFPNVVEMHNWIKRNFPDASKAAIKSVLQKIPSFKKYKFAETARGSTKVRDGFNELVLVKKEIKKIEQIAKFIES